MLDWKLPIFPQDSHAVTVTVTVWIGVCVVVFFNLRFGWTLSGLVVPGYLAPLLLAQPASAAIIAVEAIITYLLVYALSEGLNRMSCWSSFFGRDRFFALVICSVLVRVGADGWLLPSLGRWMNQTYGLDLDYQNSLHSYGLIIVALMANCFWKPGLRRGSLMLAVTIGLTYLLVRFGLIACTNFSVGGLHYLYEDISTSLLASPKAYVILITTAFLASWMNLRYSWDFNGILIPALLALLWHEPAKIGLTLVETLWILLLASLILRLPVWRQMTMEGGRKLLLFFTIATAHRLLMAHLLPRFGIVPVTDAFGFGYLLTTLLAVKAHEKQIAVRLLRGTVQVSMLGAVLGSLAGFALTWLPSAPLEHPFQFTEDTDPKRIETEERTLGQLLQEQKVLLYRSEVPGHGGATDSSELGQFGEGVRHLLRFVDQRRREELLIAQAHLEAANYQLRLVRPRYAVLSEADPQRGNGWYVINLGHGSDLLVEVPAPLREPGSLEAGFTLFEAMNARALAVAGKSDLAPTGTSTSWNPHRTVLSRFHQLVGGREALQVRGADVEFLPITTPAPADTANRSHLWIESGLPTGMKLQVLKKRLPEFDLHWRRSTTQRRAPGGSELRAELCLSPQDRRRFQIGLGPPTSIDGEPTSTQKGHLYDWLIREKEHLARLNSEAYIPATLEEMLYLDREVVTPLIQLVARRDCFAAYRGEDWEQLAAIRVASSAIHYDLIPFRDQTTGDDLLILCETAPKNRFWGTYVFRCGLRHPYAVEIPRPIQERYAYEFGASLFERPPASVLLVAGAHPDANQDGSADVTRLANKVSAFNLVRQVLLREQLARPLVITQARAIRAPVDADVVLAIDDGVPRLGTLPALIQRVVNRLEQDGLIVMPADGSLHTAGYELGILLQASATNHSENKRMVSLWLSPSMRRKFRESTDSSLFQAQFDAVGIPTREAELSRYLCDLAAQPATEPCEEELQQTVWAYLENTDIIRLWKLRQDWPSWQLIRILDPASGQAFLLASRHESELPTVFNLTGAIDPQRRFVIPQLTAEAVRDFVHSRAGCLEIECAP